MDHQMKFLKSKLTIGICLFWIIIALFPNWRREPSHYGEKGWENVGNGRMVGRSFVFFPDYDPQYHWGLDDTSKIDIERFAVENIVMGLLVCFWYIIYRRKNEAC